MSLPGCAAIPAPYRERGQIAYETGAPHRGDGARGPQALRHPDPRGLRERHRHLLRHRRIDQCADPSDRDGASISASSSTSMTGRRSASTCRSWSTCSRPATISARNITAPAGCRRCCSELLKAGPHARRRADGERQDDRREFKRAKAPDGDVIRAYDKPLKPQAGFKVLKGNLFDSAIMKTSVISEDFRAALSVEPEGPERVRRPRRGIRRAGGLSRRASTIRR